MYLFRPLKAWESWIDPDQPFTSQPMRNVHGKKFLFCVFGEITGESCVLRTAETWCSTYWWSMSTTKIKLNRASKEKGPEYARGHDKITFQHDRVRLQVSKCMKNHLGNIFKKFAVFTGLCSFELSLLSVYAAWTFKTTPPFWRMIGRSQKRAVLLEKHPFFNRKVREITASDGQYFDY